MDEMRLEYGISWVECGLQGSWGYLLLLVHREQVGFFFFFIVNISFAVSIDIKQIFRFSNHKTQNEPHPVAEIVYTYLTTVITFLTP